MVSGAAGPETVSTDYDTSDRLYFQAAALGRRGLRARAVSRSRHPVRWADAPLKLARALEGLRSCAILGTPFDAVDLAEDKRFAALCDGSASASPAWGMGRRRRRGRSGGRAGRIPVLVRPFVRARRPEHGRLLRRVRPCGTALEGVRTLVDRFLRRCRDRRRRGLRRRRHLGRRCHAARRAEGVHSSDSSCVLPAQDLVGDPQEIEDVVCRLARALGVVGVVNVQPVADGEVFVLEVNPRASRTLPFASKAIGVNLVDAGCRVAAGDATRRPRHRGLRLPVERGAPGQRQSGRAPVHPFPGRRPGAGAEDALDRRSDGERLGLRARSRRPNGRRVGRSRRRHRVPVGSRRRRTAAVPLALRSPGWASRWWPPRARPGRSRRLAFRSSASARWGDWRGLAVVDLVRRGRCDLVINTPGGGSGARSDGCRIREAALSRGSRASRRSRARRRPRAIANARAARPFCRSRRISAQARSA